VKFFAGEGTAIGRVRQFVSTAFLKQLTFDFDVWHMHGT